MELPGYSTIRAVVSEDPNGQLIELFAAAEEIRRVRKAHHVKEGESDG